MVDNMKIKITKDIIGSANEHGSATQMYKVGDEMDCVHDWQKKLAMQFMEASSAEEIKTVVPTETKKVRARTKTGHFKSDDPSTPDIDEAWEIKTK